MLLKPSEVRCTVRASRFAAAAAATAAAVLLSACGAADNSDASDSSKKAAAIALFLPESKTTRYEAFDRPLFEAKVKALCADCKVLYFNADQDPAKQQQQVEAALTQGADVLVLDAVDANAVAPMVNQAQRRKSPGVPHDGLICGIVCAFYVRFNTVRGGERQGQAVLDAMNAK